MPITAIRCRAVEALTAVEYLQSRTGKTTTVTTAAHPLLYPAGVNKMHYLTSWRPAAGHPAYHHWDIFDGPNENCWQEYVTSMQEVNEKDILRLMERLDRNELTPTECAEAISTVKKRVANPLVIVDDLINSNIVLMSVWAPMLYKTVLSLCAPNTTITGWVPIAATSAHHQFVEDRVAYSGFAFPISRDLELENALKYGSPLNCTSGKWWRIKVIGECLGHNRVLFEPVTTKVMYSLANSAASSGDNVTILRPMFDVDGLLSGRNPIRVERITIMARIYEKLQSRLLVPDCTEADLRAYARTLMSSHVVTATAMYDAYSVNVNDFENTLDVAWTVHTRVNEQWLGLLGLLAKNPDTPVDRLKTLLTSWALDKLPVITKFVQEYMLTQTYTMLLTQSQLRLISDIWESFKNLLETHIGGKMGVVNKYEKKSNFTETYIIPERTDGHDEDDFDPDTSGEDSDSEYDDWKTNYDEFAEESEAPYEQGSDTYGVVPSTDRSTIRVRKFEAGDCATNSGLLGKAAAAASIPTMDATEERDNITPKRGGEGQPILPALVKARPMVETSYDLTNFPEQEQLDLSIAVKLPPADLPISDIERSAVIRNALVNWVASREDAQHSDNAAKPKKVESDRTEGNEARKSVTQLTATTATVTISPSPNSAELSVWTPENERARQDAVKLPDTPEQATTGVEKGSVPNAAGRDASDDVDALEPEPPMRLSPSILVPLQAVMPVPEMPRMVEVGRRACGQGPIPKIMHTYWADPPQITQAMTVLNSTYPRNWKSMAKNFQVFNHQTHAEQVWVNTNLTGTVAPGPAFVSDIVRLRHLYNEGGMWLDYTSYFSHDPEMLIDYLNQMNSEGFLYVSRPVITNSRGTALGFESWFIITKPKNELWLELMQHLIAGFNVCGYDGDAWYNWIGDTFGSGVRDVGYHHFPHNESYLLIYILFTCLTVQWDITGFARADGLTGPLRLFPINANLFTTEYANPLSDKCLLSGYVYKLVKPCRDSVLAELDRNGCKITGKIRSLTSLKPNNTRPVRVWVLAIGTGGDRDAAVRVCDLMSHMDVEVTLYTHSDLLIPTYTRWAQKPLAITSAQLLPLSLEMTEGNALNIRHATQYMKAITRCHSSLMTSNEEVDLIVTQPYNIMGFLLSLKKNSEIMTYQPFPWGCAALGTIKVADRIGANADLNGTKYIRAMMHSVVGHLPQEDQWYANQTLNASITSYPTITMYDEQFWGEFAYYNKFMSVNLGPVQDDSRYFEPKDYHALKKKIQRNGRVVAINLGSMTGPTQFELIKAVIEECASYQLQILVMCNTSTASELKTVLPENVRFTAIGRQQWSKVAGLCKFVVIHGGAGTIACTLKERIPMVVAPQMVDQFAAAERVEALNLGLRYYPGCIKRVLTECGSFEHACTMYAPACADAEPVKVVKLLQATVFSRVNTNREAVNYFSALWNNTVLPMKTALPTVEIDEVSRVSGLKYEVELDPDTDGFCVTVSLMHLAGDDPVSVPVSLLAKRELLTHGETLGLLHATGHSVLLIREGVATFYPNHLKTTMAFEIIGQDVCHCRVVKVDLRDAEFHNAEPPLIELPRVPDRVKTLVTVKRNRFETLRKELEIDWPTIWRISKCQYEQVATRVKRQYIEHYGQLSEGAVVSDTHCVWPHGRVCYFDSEIGFVPAAVYKTNTHTIYILLSIVGWVGPVAWDSGTTCTLGDRHEQPIPAKALKTKNLKIYALNQETLRIMNSQNYPNAGVIPRNATEVGKVIIGYYDNRAHHTYDEKDIIELYSVDWMGHIPSPAMLKELTTSHNAPYNRLVFVNGGFRYVLEADTVALATLLGIMLLESEFDRNGGNLVYRQKIQTSVFDKVASKYKLQIVGGNKVAAMEGRPQSMKLKELIAARGNSVTQEGLLETTNWTMDTEVVPFDGPWSHLGNVRDMDEVLTLVGSGRSHALLDTYTGHLWRPTTWGGRRRHAATVQHQTLGADKCVPVPPTSDHTPTRHSHSDQVATDNTAKALVNDVRSLTMILGVGLVLRSIDTTMRLLVKHKIQLKSKVVVRPGKHPSGVVIGGTVATYYNQQGNQLHKRLAGGNFLPMWVGFNVTAEQTERLILTNGWACNRLVYYKGNIFRLTVATDDAILGVVNWVIGGAGNRLSGVGLLHVKGLSRSQRHLLETECNLAVNEHGLCRGKVAPPVATVAQICAMSNTAWTPGELEAALQTGPSTKWENIKVYWEDVEENVQKPGLILIAKVDNTRVIISLETATVWKKLPHCSQVRDGGSVAFTEEELDEGRTQDLHDEDQPCNKQLRCRDAILPTTNGRGEVVQVTLLAADRSVLSGIRHLLDRVNDPVCGLQIKLTSKTEIQTLGKGVNKFGLKLEYPVIRRLLEPQRSEKLAIVLGRSLVPHSVKVATAALYQAGFGSELDLLERGWKLQDFQKVSGGLYVCIKNGKKLLLELKNCNLWESRREGSKYVPKSEPVAGDWWGLRPKNVTARPDPNYNIMAYGVVPTTYSASKPVGPTNEIEVVDTEVFTEAWNYAMDEVDLYNMVTAEVQDLWTNTDLTTTVDMHLPDQGKFISTEQPQTIRKYFKTTLTPFPERSRPVLTKMAMAESNSLSLRTLRRKVVRTKRPSIQQTLNAVSGAFFRNDWEVEVERFSSNHITFNPIATAEWLMGRRGVGDIMAQLKEFLDGDQVNAPVSNVKFHLKLEALLKDSPILNWFDGKTRSIIWQPKHITALFSPIILEVKRRIKLLLSPDVLYTDGYTPEEIGMFLARQEPANWYFSDDLEQQDAQTDETLIAFEMYLYGLVGMERDALWLWSQVHEDWELRSHFLKHKNRSMRLTGQATTAIGNCCNTLQTRCDMVVKQRRNNNFSFAIILGDDFLSGHMSKFSLAGIPQHVRENYNMISNPTLTQGYGEFCCMVVGQHNGVSVIGPDLIRLRHRFEVTNGVSLPTDENMRMRAMSYGMMLGPFFGVAEVALEKMWPCRPIPWYDPDPIILATANKWHVSQDEVLNQVALLVHAIKELPTHQVEFTMWTSQVRRK